MIIRPAIADDIPSLKTLLQATFGPRPDQESLLAAWINDPSRVVLVATSGAALIGCAAGRSALDPAPHYTAFSVDWTQYPRVLWGSLLLLAVAPSHKRQGIGMALGQALFERLKALGCGAFIAVSWGHGGLDNSASLLTKAGWQCAAQSETFYRTQSPACARCQSECHCVALLYITTNPKT